MPTGRSLGHPQEQSWEAKPTPSRRVLITRSGVFTCRCCWFPPDKNVLDKQEFPAGPGVVAQRGTWPRWDVQSLSLLRPRCHLSSQSCRRGCIAPPSPNLSVQEGDEPPPPPAMCPPVPGLGTVPKFGDRVRVNGGRAPWEGGGWVGCTPGHPSAGGGWLWGCKPHMCPHCWVAGGGGAWAAQGSVQWGVTAL